MWRIPERKKATGSNRIFRQTLGLTLMATNEKSTDSLFSMLWNRYVKVPYFRFQAAGIAVMAVGIFARVSASDYSALMDEGGFKTAANILIAAGALVMIIGAIGCCGVVKEKKWLLLLVSYKLLKIGP